MDEAEKLSTEELLRLFENDNLSVDDATLMESMAGPMETIEVNLPKVLLKALNEVSEHDTFSSQLRVALFQYLSESHSEALQDASEVIEPGTQIRTDSGLKSVEDVQMSQKLHGLVTREVQAVHPADADNNLKIETEDETIELTDNHELLVKGEGALNISLKSANELKPGDRLIKTAHISQVFPDGSDEDN